MLVHLTVLRAGAYDYSPLAVDVFPILDELVALLISQLVEERWNEST